MDMNYCRRCGTKLSLSKMGGFTCEQNHKLYINAAPTVGALFVTDDKQVIMSVRGIEPYKGAYDAFGGFVDENESVEAALAREIQEEVNLPPDQYESPQFLCSATINYPYGGENRTVLSILFWSKLKPNAKPKADDDVADIRYVPLKDFDFSVIGTRDIELGIRKLQEMFF